MYISNGIKQIVQLSLPPMLQALNHKVFGVVKEVASETGVKAYVVGGYVRDIFLNRISKDVDFTVIGDGIDFATQVAHKLGESANVNVFKNFGTAIFPISIT